MSSDNISDLLYYESNRHKDTSFAESEPFDIEDFNDIYNFDIDQSYDNIESTDNYVETLDELIDDQLIDDQYFDENDWIDFTSTINDNALTDDEDIQDVDYGDILPYYD